jgi:hypothetical protein
VTERRFGFICDHALFVVRQRRPVFRFRRGFAEMPAAITVCVTPAITLHGSREPAPGAIWQRDVRSRNATAKRKYSAAIHW